MENMPTAKNSAIVSAYAILFTFATGAVALEIYSSPEEEPIVSELRLRQIAAKSVLKTRLANADSAPDEAASSSRIAANRRASKTR